MPIYIFHGRERYVYKDSNDTTMNHIHQLRLLNTAAVIASAMIFSSCSHPEPEAADVAPLYAVFYELSQDTLKTRLNDVTDRYGNEIKAFIEVVNSVRNDSVTIESWPQSDVVKIFSPDVMKVFPTPDVIGETASYMTDAVRRNGLDLPEYRYAAVVWGLNKSIIFSDSIAMIALNHYLGADYPGYAGMPAYRRARKTAEMLPYDMTEAVIATGYPYAKSEQSTVLSRLLYEGALAEAKLRLTPDATEAGVLGYDDEAYRRLNENEAEIWKTLATRDLLYDINEMTASHLVDELPATNIISPETPGRAGRFIGHRIVASYLRRHPETTLQQLLSPGFYDNQETLVASGYSPR